jgi:voltage-gated potassium channel
MTLSSEFTTTQKLNKKAMARELLFAILRTVGLIFLISFILSNSPQEQNVRAVGVIIGMCVLATIYVLFFIRSIRAVQKSQFPNIRAGEAMLSSGVLLLAIFASIYSAMSLQNEGAFTEALTPFSSMYFALTILATVGFGDIAPITVSARAVAMGQMVLDLVFIGVLVRVFTNVAKQSLANRANAQIGSD